MAQGKDDKAGIEVGRLQTKVGWVEGRLDVVTLER